MMTEIQTIEIGMLDLIITSYLMCPPISFDHRNIEINITDNLHFALAYLLGITRPTFTRSTGQEPSIHTIRTQNLKLRIF